MKVTTIVFLLAAWVVTPLISSVVVHSWNILITSELALLFTYSIILWLYDKKQEKRHEKKIANR